MADAAERSQPRRPVRDRQRAADEGVVYGVHAVAALLASGPERIAEIWYQKGQGKGRLRAIVAGAREADVRLEERSRDEIDARVVAGARHQGVVAILGSNRRHWSEADLEAIVSASEDPALLLILDGVQDPHNLGACLRTADAAGVQAVIVPKNRAVGLTATVSKVACGAAETVPLIEVTNLGRCMRRLKDLGVWLVGTAAEAERPVYEIEMTMPVAIALGAEGKGLRRMTREQCDFLASIPLAGSVASLNVSVAAAVCLFEVVRQRASGVKRPG